MREGPGLQGAHRANVYDSREKDTQLSSQSQTGSAVFGVDRKLLQWELLKPAGGMWAERGGWRRDRAQRSHVGHWGSLDGREAGNAACPIHGSYVGTPDQLEAGPILWQLQSPRHQHLCPALSRGLTSQKDLPVYFLFTITMEKPPSAINLRCLKPLCLPLSRVQESNKWSSQFLKFGWFSFLQESGEINHSSLALWPSKL